MIRNFSSSAASAFKNQSVNMIKSTPKVSHHTKPISKTGSSFKSFKEYRLKIVNQSPLNKAVLEKVKPLKAA